MATQPTKTRIKVANPPIDDNVRAYLTADTNAGATTMYLTSSNGFTGSSFYVLIGEYGDEKAEIKLVSSFSGATFTVAALTYSHEASDPVTFISYNQIRYYGMATNVEPGIADSPIITLEIDCSAAYTEYIYEGTAYTYFCTAYYNSASEKLSAYSEIITSSTFTRQSVKRVIESGLRKAMTKLDDSTDGDITWDIALEIVIDGIDEILARKRKWSFLRTRSTAGTTTANVTYVAKPTDLSLLEYIAVNGYKLELFSMQDYLIRTESGATTTTGQPTHYTFKENRIHLYPTPDASYTVEIDYYKVPAELTELSDEIDYVFVPILIYFCGSQFALLRGNDKRSKDLYIMFEKLLEQQVIEFSGPESSDAEYIEWTNFIDTEYDGNSII